MQILQSRASRACKGSPFCFKILAGNLRAQPPRGFSLVNNEVEDEHQGGSEVVRLHKAAT